jgi:putative phosphoserine phosphatase/1-acylglycerol-3-phosphate O-acyltransferase
VAADPGVSRLIEQIRAGESGPKVGAIFDFDGTLIDGYSAATLYQYRLLHGDLGPFELWRTARRMRGPTLDEDGFVELVHDGLKSWNGRSWDDFTALGRELCSGTAGGFIGNLFHDAWRLVRAHKAMDHTVVIATSATEMQVAPLAEQLEIEHVLCTRLEVIDGLLTGKVAGRTLWGPGKIAAVKEFAAERDIDLMASHAYANGDEDVPLLAAVGRPHPVNPQPELAEEAERRGWPALTFDSGRAGRLDIRPALRTATLFGTFFGSAGAGAALGLLNKSRRTGVDLAGTFFDTFAGPLTGIDVEVIGQENAWAARPAVFLINHQSHLVDFLATVHVLRRGFTAVAKAEVKQMPLVGPLFDLAGVAFLDRTDRDKAIEALGPALEKLRNGTSIVIAPEGTRSLTPLPGPFKKGGFHLAMQAGVPIVPVVIRNAGELMWRRARTVRSGTVEVAVLPPIPTTGWTKADVDEQVVAVRRLYIDTLENWPA